MTLESLLQLLTILNQKEYRIAGEWVMFSCPVARYRHYKKTDTSPSFGIKVSTGASVFHCFSCMIKGRLAVLPNILMAYKHPAHRQVREFIAKNEPLMFIESRQDELEFHYSPMQIIPEEVLDLYMPFGKWNKINSESVKKWELKIDTVNRCIVFPIRDKFGRLVGLKKRFKDKKFIEDRQFSTESPKRRGVWYGIHLVDANKTVYLVEGERDAILLHQEGLQAVASMGASITPAQLGELRNFSTIICFFDNDDAGKKATQTVLGRYPKARVVNYFGAKDPAELVEKDMLKNFINFA